MHHAWEWQMGMGTHLPTTCSVINNGGMKKDKGSHTHPTHTHTRTHLRCHRARRSADTTSAASGQRERQYTRQVTLSRQRRGDTAEEQREGKYSHFDTEETNLFAPTHPPIHYHTLTLHEVAPGELHEGKPTSKQKELGQPRGIWLVDGRWR